MRESKMKHCEIHDKINHQVMHDNNMNFHLVNVEINLVAQQFRKLKIK